MSGGFLLAERLIRGAIGGVVTSLVLVLASGSAAAKPHEYEAAALTWARAADAAPCPDGAEMARMVEGRLGQGALLPLARAEVVVEASIRARSGGGFHVDIALARDEVVVGRRELESAQPDCGPIADEAALVIALTIDPEASPLTPSLERAEPLPAPSGTPAPPAPGPASSRRASPPPPASRPPNAARPSWQLDLELAADIATGLLPGVAPGASLRGRLVPPGWPLGVELESSYFPQQSLALPSGEGARFELYDAGLGLCANEGRTTRFRAWLCAGPELAVIMGRGYGFERTARFSRVTVALSARGGLGLRVTEGLVLALGPDVIVPLGRDRFVAITPAGTEPLYRMSAVGLGLELGAVWEL